MSDEFENREPRLEHTFEADYQIYSMIFAEKDTKLFSGDSDGNLVSYDFPGKKKLVCKMGAHRGTIWFVDYDERFNIVATAGQDSSVKIWNSELSQGPLAIMGEHADCVNSIQFSDISEQVISASDDKSIKIFNVSTLKVVETLEHCQTHYNMAANFFNRDQMIVSGAKQVKIFDLRLNEKCIHTFPLQPGYLYSVRVHEETNTIASGCDHESPQIQMWDLRNYKLLHNYKEFKKGIRELDFHYTGKYILSGSTDKTIKIFDLVTKRVMCSLPDQGGIVKGVRFSSDGRYFASGGDDKKVKVWKTNVISTINDLMKLEDMRERSDYVKNNIKDVFVKKLGCFSIMVGGSMMLVTKSFLLM